MCKEGNGCIQILIIISVKRGKFQRKSQKGINHRVKAFKAKIGKKMLYRDRIGFLSASEGEATVTFSQECYKSRIRKLVTERPEECGIVAENQDGSICAHIPVRWVEITPTKELSEKQLKQAIENFSKCRSIRHGKG